MTTSSSSLVVVAVSLLVLSLIFTGAQGIRFKKGLSLSKQHEDELIHEERKISLTKTSDGSVAEAVRCKEAGNCNTGMNRKLLSTISITFTSTTNTKNDEKNKAKANANSTSKSKSSDGKILGEQTEESYNSSPDLYGDIIDIAEMDYSPARRKPPIHN